MPSRWTFLALVVVAGCTVRASGTGQDTGAGTVDAAVIENDASDPARDAPIVRDDTDVDAAALTCDGAMITLPSPTSPDGSDETDPPDCTDCPHFTSVEVTPSGTTATIHATVTGSTSCTWTLVSPSCGGTTGAFGVDPEFGMASLTLPLFCGTNRLQLVCENASGRAFATRSVQGPSCGGRDVQVTLTWGAVSDDQELHLVREGAHINDMIGDCTWFTCVLETPDWGVIGDPTDDPHKDVDWLGPFGPENIYLTRAPDGRYEVMVEYWGSGTLDTANVTITLDGRTVWMGSHAVRVHDVWDVGTIVFPSGTFIPVDTVASCAAAWQTGGSRGCALAIP